MLRAFRGTVFYNRCRQPPHVRFSLSLSLHLSRYILLLHVPRSESCSFLVVVEENAGSQPSSCHHHRRIRFSLLSPSKSSIGKETRSKILPPPPSSSSSSPSRLWNGWISLCPRSDETFSCKKKKKKEKNKRKEEKKREKRKKSEPGNSIRNERVQGPCTRPVFTAL